MASVASESKRGDRTERGSPGRETAAAARADRPASAARADAAAAVAGDTQQQDQMLAPVIAVRLSSF